jgi:hypothetical protein
MYAPCTREATCRASPRLARRTQHSLRLAGLAQTYRSWSRRRVTGKDDADLPERVNREISLPYRGRRHRPQLSPADPARRHALHRETTGDSLAVATCSPPQRSRRPKSVRSRPHRTRGGLGQPQSEELGTRRERERHRPHPSWALTTSGGYGVWCHENCRQMLVVPWEHAMGRGR